jgi:CHAD domain-containing protein
MIFDELLRKASENPTTKCIHQIRVTIRRLGVVINSVKLNQLTKVLGHERDLEVAIANAKKYGIGNRKLKKAKKSARKKTKKKMQLFNEKSLRETSQKNLLMKYKNMMKELNLELEDFESIEMTNKQFHRFRITLKKVRYGLEAIGQIRPQLERMQDILGHMHDLEVLQGLVGKKNRIKKDKRFAKNDAQAEYLSVVKIARRNLMRI